MVQEIQKATKHNPMPHMKTDSRRNMIVESSQKKHYACLYIASVVKIPQSLKTRLLATTYLGDIRP